MRTIKARTFLLLFTLPSLLASSCHGEELITIQVGEQSLRVELARNPEERARGLMHRRRLPSDQGMLFIFESPQHLSFWMKDTLIPLSIAYISANGTIKQIEHMRPQSLTPIQSRHRVLYALEVNRGWFREKGIQPGDKILLPEKL